MLPQEFFEIRKVWDKSRFATVVAVHMACSVLHPIFSCPYTQFAKPGDIEFQEGTTVTASGVTVTNSMQRIKYAMEKSI